VREQKPEQAEREMEGPALSRVLLQSHSIKPAATGGMTSDENSEAAEEPFYASSHKQASHDKVGKSPHSDVGTSISQ
jgi:hypothetical protein